MKITTRRLLAALAVTVATATSANAETIYGVNGANELVTFDSATPNTYASTVTIVGATILNLDFRPNGGALYGLDADNNLYTINTLTGAATLVGNTTISEGFDYGFDFNPVVDLVRVVTDSAANFRVNPNTGTLVSSDPDTTYAAGDPNELSTPGFTGAAYSNNFTGASNTTLFTIDPTLDVLASATNANLGTYVTVGGLGVDVTGLMGFDISALGNVYAALSVDASPSQLYTINLNTGVATLVGGIGSPAGDTILDITAVPEPSTVVLAGLGIAGVRLMFRRRKA